MVSVVEETKTNSRAEAAQALFGPMIEEFLDLKFPEIADKLLIRADEVLDQKLGKMPAQTVEITREGEVVKSLPRQHYLLPAMLKLLNTHDRYGNKLNIALVGPTGTGKTRMGISAAQALECQMTLQPFNPHTTKGDLMGYMSATGTYVESPFYKAFKTGHLFIADEFDAANPAIATILNAAVSNRVVTFPNGETVEAHKDFRAIFCMNTYGTGGDDRYTGRNRLDIATLDRMIFLYVPIDPGLEAAIIGINDVSSPDLNLEDGGHYENEKEILHSVVSLRGAVEDKKMRYSVSPRAAIHAEAMHRAGFGKKWIHDSCFFQGMPEEDRNKLISSAHLN